MNINRNLVAILCGTMATVSAVAVPARPGSYTVTQPDGTTLTIHKSGDERLHFTLTDDGKLLKCDADGRYCYARLTDAGELVSTGVQAYDAAVRPESHRYLTTAVESIDATRLLQKRGTDKRFLHPVVVEKKAPAKAGTAPQYGLGRFTSNFPTKGKIKGLIILCEYSDVKFNTAYSGGAHAYFDDLANKTGFSEFGGTGCAAEFFREQSMGAFDPEFVVVGPVTLNNTRAYYGANDVRGDDVRPAEMIADACRAAGAEVDFSEFDNDNDGVCDNVFVFYAGQGEASYGPDDSIWPHQWTLASGGINLTLDGVRINSYACTNEWGMNMPDGIGTFVHEYSHVMGLPDLYSTNYQNNATPGAYSTLDSGPYNNNGRTPPAYSMYERNAMGWAEPLVLEGPENGMLEHVLSSNQGYLIPTEKNAEFFLLENRQQVGWDKYIPNHGMLIWHIDYVKSIFDGNNVNNNAGHCYVDIVEANDNYRIAKGYVWPGTANKTEFTSTTTPALKSWAGLAIDLPITDIVEANGLVTFKVAGGGIDAPRAVEPADKGDDWFDATWSSVDGATDYMLSIYGIRTDITPETETADFGTYMFVPDGWTTTTTDTNTTSGSFNSVPASLKLSESGQRITTRVYDNDVESVSFWYKGLSGLTFSSTLLIEANVNGEWKTVATVIPSNKAENTEITGFPAGSRQVRLTFTKNKGNMAIDDITVKTGAGATVLLDGYDNRSVGNATTHRVSVAGLPYGQYRYSVRSTDGNTVSRYSNEVIVTMSTGGVDDIVADADTAPVVLLNGRTATVRTNAPRVAVHTATGAAVANVAVADGEAVVTVPAAGFYIITAGTHSVKVAMH